MLYLSLFCYLCSTAFHIVFFELIVRLSIKLLDVPVDREGLLATALAHREAHDHGEEEQAHRSYEAVDQELIKLIILDIHEV